VDDDLNDLEGELDAELSRGVGRLGGKDRKIGGGSRATTEHLHKNRPQTERPVSQSGGVVRDSPQPEQLIQPRGTGGLPDRGFEAEVPGVASRVSSDGAMSGISVKKAFFGKSLADIKNCKLKVKSEKKTKGKKVSKRSKSSSSGGEKDGEESGSDSSSSVFRAASSSQGRMSQGGLMRWARRHPGRLAARALQGMEDRVGRDGEHEEWERTEAPASAKSYYLRELRDQKPPLGLRSLREANTLCHILDHLALGRTREAADVAVQRLKSIEMNSATGDWLSTSLELVPNDTTSLVSRDEYRLVQKETEARRKMGSQFPYKPYKPDYKGYGKGKDTSDQHEWIPYKPYKGNGKGKGKGKDKKGKEKRGKDDK
jgi:hypothetical protein